MRSLRSAWALLAVAAATVPVLASPAAAIHRRPVGDCKTVGTTIAANGAVRVYRRGGRTEYVAYACLTRTGRTRRLGQFDSDGGPRAFALAGRFVAYDHLICTHFECRGGLRVLDVRSGAIRRIPLAAGRGHATAVEVTESGAVAWIRTFSAPDNSAVFAEVRKHDADGETVLDSGPGIDRNSLARSGAAVYWTHDGSPRSASLR